MKLRKLDRLSHYGCQSIGSTTTCNSGGFTLIELLVVIAIIAMLIAIMVPSLHAARVSAKRVVCQTNLKTLANAWIEYLDDHDGYFLQGVNKHATYGGKKGAIRAFQKPRPLNMYVGLPELVDDGADMFRCPADTGSRTIRPTYYDYMGTSYETNRMLIAQNKMWVHSEARCVEVLKQVNTRLRRMNRNRVHNPGKVLLIGDFGWVASWIPWNTKHVEWHGKPLSHNIAFMDTHVEFVQIRKGMHVTPQYSVIPFKDIANAAIECQEEGPLHD